MFYFCFIPKNFLRAFFHILLFLLLFKIYAKNYSVLLRERERTFKGRIMVNRRKTGKYSLKNKSLCLLLLEIKTKLTHE